MGTWIYSVYKLFGKLKCSFGKLMCRNRNEVAKETLFALT